MELYGGRDALSLPSPFQRLVINRHVSAFAAYTSSLGNCRGATQLHFYIGSCAATDSALRQIRQRHLNEAGYELPARFLCHA